ncbi:MAG: hypothetical protein Q8S33_07740 [Myxococcales bacterium]|nr:hypothetical protein [Myxococcales bacterium]
MFALGALRVVQTGLSSEEAISGLRRVTMPGALFALDRPKPGSPPLRGTIDGLRFSVVRRTQFRNSFTPVVEGVIVPGEVGSQVQLQLGLHLVPAVTLVTWLFTMLALGVLAAQSQALAEMALMLVGVSLAGPVIGFVAYRADASAVVEEISLAVTQSPTSSS